MNPEIQARFKRSVYRERYSYFTFQEQASMIEMPLAPSVAVDIYKATSDHFGRTQRSLSDMDRELLRYLIDSLETANFVNDAQTGESAVKLKINYRQMSVFLRLAMDFEDPESVAKFYLSYKYSGGRVDRKLETEVCDALNIPEEEVPALPSKSKSKSKRLIIGGVAGAGAVLLAAAYDFNPENVHIPSWSDISPAFSPLSTECGVPTEGSQEVQALAKATEDILADYSPSKYSGKGSKEALQKVNELTLEKVKVLKGKAIEFLGYNPYEICLTDEGNLKLFQPEGNGYGIFYMRSPSDVIYATSLVDGLFNRQFAVDADQPQRYLQNLVDFYWLTASFKAEIGDVRPIIPVGDLEQISRILQVVQKSGHRLPKTIRFDTDYDQRNKDKMVFASYSGVFDYYYGISDVIALHITDWDDILSRYQAVDKSYTRVDAANSLNNYLAGGDELRARIRYVEIRGTQEQAEEDAKIYAVSQEYFGVEFTGSSYIKKPTVDIAPGDYVRIDDVLSRGAKPLSLLRNDHRTKTGLTVADNEWVQIIGEGVLDVDDSIYEANTFFEIRKGRIEEIDGKLFFIPSVDTGWIKSPHLKK